jgi:hypothetical protein
MGRFGGFVSWWCIYTPRGTKPRRINHCFKAKGFKEIDGVRIPENPEACKTVEDLLQKLKRSGNYNMGEYVGSFEEVA